MNNELAKEIVKHLMREVEDGLERSKHNSELNYGNVVKNHVARNYYAGKIDAYEEVKMLLKTWKESLGKNEND